MDKNNDSVFLRDGRLAPSSEEALAKEEELLDAWLSEIWKPGATEAEERLFDMAANGIPVAENVRIRVCGRDLNGGHDMANIDARPNPAVEVGINFSF